jgi:5'-nucleotidase
MRILITNDDGVNSEGLAVLERIARRISDDVTVIAPEFDQSGVAHSLSLNDPLRIREVAPGHYAVKGTPTDCVLMGVHKVMQDRKPDLVLSGVNHGHNLAEDVFYSGTVAGAREGAILGFPSIALSQGFAPGMRDQIRWDCAETHAPAILEKLLAEGVPRDRLINVNFPGCAPQEVAGVAVTTQGRRDMSVVSLEERRDGRQRPYFWIRYGRSRATPPPGTDLDAVYSGRISITPLQLDLTDRALQTRLGELFA